MLKNQYEMYDIKIPRFNQDNSTQYSGIQVQQTRPRVQISITTQTNAEAN